MKKKRFLGILLGLALAMAMVLGMSTSAYADEKTVVWEGEQAITEDTPVTIDKDSFANIKMGDKLVVQFKDAAGSPLLLKSNKAFLPGVNCNIIVFPEDSTREVYATEAMVKSLKQYGLEVGGNEYTALKVWYEAGGRTMDEDTVWSGDLWVDSWSTLDLSVTSFNDVDWDSIQAIRFISDAGRSDWVLNVMVSFDEGGKVADQSSMTWNDNYFELSLDGIDMAAKLKDQERLYIQGDKNGGESFNFTQVQLVPKPGYPLWVGEIQVNDGNKDDVLGDADEGATVTFTPAVEGDNPTPATLTLNNAVIRDKKEWEGGTFKNIYAKDMDLTPQLIGTNTIDSGTGPKASDASANHGINIGGSLIIDGTGSLMVNGQNFAIRTEKNCAINNCEVTASASRGSAIFSSTGACTISDASLNATGGMNGIYAYSGLASTDAFVAATGTKCGITSKKGSVTIGCSNVTAAATGTEDDSYGIEGYKGVTIDSQSAVVASGNSAAISGNLKNDIAGTGWADTAGTKDRAGIDVSTTGQTLDYKRVQFPEAPVPAVKTVTINVSTISAKVLDEAVAMAGGSSKTVTIFVLGSKVKKINKSAFKKYKKVKTLTLKTKKLKKAKVKNSLKGSEVKTIEVNVGSKKVNKKYVKKYKKIFTKKNAGKKVRVTK